jgi:diketogulonate reductase-like aldo/keto reductase/sugar-specific transcriptional regulator TrmB
MTTNKILKNIGLTENESEVYLGFLKYGENMTSTISKNLDIDKSSCYRAVERLEQKGLLTKKPKKRGTTYKATHPNNLRDLIKHKKADLEKSSKDLNTYITKLLKSSTHSRESKVEILRGYEGLTYAISDGLNTKEKIMREIWRQNIPIVQSKKYKKFIVEHAIKRINKKIFIKSLSNIKGIRTYGSLTVKNEGLMRTSKSILKDLRILPHEFENQNMIRIYDDTAYIFSSSKKEELIILKIKDKIAVGMLKDLFDYIFERSAVFYGKSPLPSISINKKRFSKLGIGSWGIGGYAKRNPYNDDNQDIQQLIHSISLGENYIDTSLSYAEGYSVDLISKAIKNIPRESLFINGKLTYKKNWKPIEFKKEVEEQCDEYLRKLNTDYLDSFMIHSPFSINMSITDTVKAIDKLIDKGKVKHLFVSNFFTNHLEEALAATKHGISAHEIHYNLIIRANEENDVIDFCNNNNILIIAYQPLRRGFIYTLEDEPLIRELCEKYNKTPGQIAINWLVNKENVMTICKSTNGSHINENVAALGWKMKNRDYKRLDEWRIPGYKSPMFDKNGLTKDGLNVSKL